MSLKVSIWQIINPYLFQDEWYNPNNIPTNTGNFDNWGLGITLDNGQSFIEDITVTGTLIADMNIVQVSPSIALPMEITMWGTVIADNTVRVYIENQTGDSITIPSIQVKTKKL